MKFIALISSLTLGGAATQYYRHQEPHEVALHAYKEGFRAGQSTCERPPRERVLP